MWVKHSVLWEDVLTLRLVASRPKGAPPLVLLDADDIKNEITLWTAYEAALLEDEQRLLARIPHSLENL